MLGFLTAFGLATGQAQVPARPALPQGLRFGAGLGYTVGPYSEFEGHSSGSYLFAGRWRLDAGYAVHTGNDRVTAALGYRWPVGARVEVHVDLGGFWLPPHGFAPEAKRLGGLALMGLEHGPSRWLTRLGLDTWTYVEVQAVTQRTVHVPVAAGLRFGFRRPQVPVP